MGTRDALHPAIRGGPTFAISHSLTRNRQPTCPKEEEKEKPTRRPRNGKVHPGVIGDVGRRRVLRRGEQVRGISPDAEFGYSGEEGIASRLVGFAVGGDVALIGAESMDVGREGQSKSEECKCRSHVGAE